MLKKKPTTYWELNCTGFTARALDYGFVISDQTGENEALQTGTRKHGWITPLVDLVPDIVLEDMFNS
jgi:hypothetical protein